MLEEMSKMAKGATPFRENKIAEALLLVDLREFRKMPPRVQTWAGLYLSAKQFKEQLEEVA
jgi:hypothetical protein